MQIQKITVVNNENALMIAKQHSSKTPSASSTQQNVAALTAYKDYNISFSGRTPEDFYSQDFNRENMPKTMKEYLNYDYEQRQHIPPEQMMNEAFKYLEIADNFDEVKEIYPEEDLFKNLHDNKTRHRKNVLAEINMAKELSDIPLLKDGTDNFGMYLLKKIYLEGKTLKEISKDFYEKDLSDEYKGVITKPIDYETTSAFGIRYPKQEFWHSFIATREEYKKFFVTLPKNTVNPSVHLKNTNFNSTKKFNSPEETPPVNPVAKRKYKLKDYHKKQITDDIKEAQANEQEIEKKIKKRFAKDDPQASFIVKYLSPIMAVAADRIHLSEEMKGFCEAEKDNGKIGDDEYMFKRFWKHNPQLLNYYAQTITDTIDLFEEVYADGGLIPINKDLEIIKPDTENKRAVDYVTPEFLELLDYTQTIMPEREKRYEEHNRLQNEWNEHFINRYGIIEENNSQKLDIDKINCIQNTDNPDLNNDIQEVFKQSLKKISEIYPKDYGSKYLKFMLNNKKIDEDYKAAYAHYVGKKEIGVVKLSEGDFQNKFDKIEADFIYGNERDSIVAKLAMIETLAQNNIRDYKLYTLNTYNFPIIDKIDKSKSNILEVLKNNKNQLNQIYLDYKTPPKPKEVNIIADELYNQILNYRTPEEVSEANTNQIILMMKESCKTPPRAEFLKYILKFSVSKFLPFAKSILNENESEAEKRAKFENIMLILIVNYLNNPKDITLLQIIGEENLQKGFRNLSEDVRMALLSKITSMEPVEHAFFKFKHSEYIKDYNEDPEMCSQKYGFQFTK